jgi:alkaline phosphatase
VSNGISLLLIYSIINSKTYSVDFQTSDSSATANALFSGVKTDSGTLGFDASIVPYDLKSELNAKKLTTIMEWAQDAGKDTGL